MSEKKENDKLKKLKNKKKDIITINPLEIKGQNTLKNNFKDKTLAEIKKEKKIIQENKINAQPLSSNQVLPQKEVLEQKNGLLLRYLSEDKDNISKVKKIILNIEYLFSYNDILEEKFCKLLIPLLSVKNLNNILEERETLDICGNFLCGKKIENKNLDCKSYKNTFCSKECLGTIQEFAKKALKNYRATNWLYIDNIIFFESLQDYYEQDKEIGEISKLGGQLFENLIKENINEEKMLREYRKKVILGLAKIYVKDFDDIVKTKK